MISPRCTQQTCWQREDCARSRHRRLFHVDDASTRTRRASTSTVSARSLHERRTLRLSGSRQASHLRCNGRPRNRAARRFATCLRRSQTHPRLACRRGEWCRTLRPCRRCESQLSSYVTWIFIDRRTALGTKKPPPKGGSFAHVATDVRYRIMMAANSPARRLRAVDVVMWTVSPRLSPSSTRLGKNWGRAGENSVENRVRQRARTRPHSGPRGPEQPDRTSRPRPL